MIPEERVVNEIHGKFAADVTYVGPPKKKYIERQHAKYEGQDSNLGCGAQDSRQKPQSPTPTRITGAPQA